MKKLIAGLAVTFTGLGTPAMAGDSYSAGSMWGTDGSGVAVSGAAASSAAHVQNGTVAGQVNAAEEGLLLATGSEGSITIQSIGSQTVVSSTISGNDNSIHTHADQDSTNSGDVTNDGQVNTGDNATNNNY
ncbi:hypothetical protein [Dichotomicrobium thermohalophilum]|uniref:Curlin associated repeat-containing protein n=1 Tax=Dichotomicrobium thermohalophilum TaxID=933063 RepID=A0A397QBZ6_9HYPH|nr:hypothetical protein [Dichotomicrobium thermohalophilum]RIA55761.1 hypothetical protein BXY53_0837 [Dichotomicrobium thermohalophilum]